MPLQLDLSYQPHKEPVQDQVWRILHGFNTKPNPDQLESVREPYSAIVDSNSRQERYGLFKAIRDEVSATHLPVEALLVFIYFEPHHRLITNALSEYLTFSLKNTDDPIKPVALLMGAVKSGITINPGAVLASLIHLGDRRFNALARITREALTAPQIRQFARSHYTCITAATVEFCLDWLLQLQATGKNESICYVASSLMLMVVHDEVGVVRDSGNLLENWAADKNDFTTSYQIFEEYLEEVLPVMNSIGEACHDQGIMDEVVSLWQSHRDKARRLRLP